MTFSKHFLGRAASYYQRLLGSLWFLPSIIVLAAVGLALGLIAISGVLASETLQRFPRVFGAGGDGSRSMLSTIAGSMVTVAGVTFSILVVAVSQASTQYTPRLMRNFMKDRLSQVTLGVLAGVFAYCLIVLRTIRSGPSEYVPEIAVAAALLLALLAVGLLMYFIHHIAGTLEAGQILSSVAAEALEAVERLFPEELGTRSVEAAHVSAVIPDDAWRPVHASSSGYIQHLDAEELLRVANELGAVIRMERAVGDFIAQGTPLLSVAHAQLDDARSKALISLFIIDTYRTSYQDVAFGLRQIVDVASKALSPSVNDSTTAITCIDYLSAVLVRLASRRIPDAERTVEGRLRVIARRPDWRELLDLSFDEIRRGASGHPRVLLRALGALELIGAAARCHDRVLAVVQQLNLYHQTILALPAADPARVTAAAACERVRRELAYKQSFSPRAGSSGSEAVRLSPS